jgi:peroxiredoxin (alkyl hydroperoxide reductase subunit C)
MAMLQLTRPAPTFTAQALVGREFKPVSLEDFKNKWVLLLFYPMDFTFVCPTELLGLSEKHAEFQQRECEVLGCSTDSVYSHLGWVKADPRLANLKYPLLADITKGIARSYGVLLEDEGIALRGAFLIDPEGVLRWMEVNDLNVGRNIDEILRVLDALKTGGLCPCNWKPGEATLS